MLEWRLIEKLVGNLKLVKTFDRILSDPVIREYCNVDPLENQGQNMELMM